MRCWTSAACLHRAVSRPWHPPRARCRAVTRCIQSALQNGTDAPLSCVHSFLRPRRRVRPRRVRATFSLLLPAAARSRSPRCGPIPAFRLFQVQTRQDTRNGTTSYCEARPVNALDLGVCKLHPFRVHSSPDHAVRLKRSLTRCSALCARPALDIICGGRHRASTGTRRYCRAHRRAEWHAILRGVTLRPPAIPSTTLVPPSTPSACPRLGSARRAYPRPP
ncbi:hypothetical protein DFH06DRAFT_672742 [Mycena polygramma]|nr:hypothetical protein DFH06DRAFT_672742 [Mycena polygramma]